MAPFPPLETARLILRPVELADAPAMQRIFPQWEIVRWLDASAVPWPYPDDGAETYLRDRLLPGIAQSRQWSWSIRRNAAPDALIGLITLTASESDHRGFWLDPAFHGQGLMSEAADAVTGYWFDGLGMPLLRVPKAVTNLASRRISQRQGMRVVATFERDYVAGRASTELWEITAEEWRARRGLRGAI